MVVRTDSVRCVLTSESEPGNIYAMEHEVDKAARRTAINLMRLNEALEMKDAESYSLALDDFGNIRRFHRMRLLRNYYKRWFTSKALRRIP